MTHADGLSRSYHLTEQESCELKDQTEYIQEMDDEPLANVGEHLDIGLGTETLLRVKRADKYLKKVFEWRLEGKVFIKN